MKVEELIIYGKKYLHSQHAKMLLADLLQVNPLELLNHLEEEVQVDIINEYKKRVEALKEKKPIQYVIGNVNFYGNKFLVNENVLIPRFETEELIENTLLYIDKIFPDKNLKVIDLGTGSGCIGITLKLKNPSFDVTLLDISKEALEVAKQNASSLNAQVKLCQNDMLENLEEKYDIIISNPPYIKENEPIEEIVKNNEPHLALYAGIDGLDCYRKILKEAKYRVNNRFLLAFEIGETQKDAIIELAKLSFPQAKIDAKKDMQNRDRMIFIYQNEDN